MRKAQGALEYLIIIAAVLAIAAIVVLFITGAFSGASGGGDIAKCRLAAATCNQNIVTGIYTDGESCEESCMGACQDSAGNDVMDGGTIVCVYEGTANSRACGYCVAGEATLIIG
jgi:hypothetical protein